MAQDKETPQAPQAKSNSSERWWEFYLVRYAPGTVFGMLVVFFLLANYPYYPCEYTSFLQFLWCQIQSLQLGGWLIGLLAFLGLAFCYIASAPILVFHATRFKPQVVIGRKVLMFTILLALISEIFFYCFLGKTPWNLFPVVMIMTYIFFAQVFPLLSFFNKPAGNIGSEYVYSQYRILADKRKVDKTDIVESYKHLREHGNAFLIICFELIFGFILFLVEISKLPSICVISTHIVILTLWVSPAAAVYFVGMRLEKEFMEETKKQEKVVVFSDRS